MTLEVLSFSVGAVMVGIAVVGGGIELRELRVPQVGTAARCGAFCIGLLFIFMGIGLSEAQRPQPVPSPGIVPPQGQALVSPGQVPAQPSVPSGSTAVPVVEVPPQPQPSPPFAGLNGRARLSWMIVGVAYEAIIETHGEYGAVRVTFTDPQTGLQKVIDQNLALRQDAGVIYYEGSNPRTAATQQPDPTYSPDLFRVVQLQVNHWTISEICDLQRLCAPVTVTPL